MDTAITPPDVIPYLIFLIPLYIAVREVRRGLKSGEMIWFRRAAGSGDEAVGEPPSKTCRKENQPKTFWSLFVFYCLIIIIVPALTAVSLLNKAGIIDWPLR